MSMRLQRQEDWHVRAEWVVRDALTRSPLASGHNLLTNSGLTNLAANWVGQGSPPLYLLISNFKATLVTSILAGVSSLTLSVAVHAAGDTHLVLDLTGTGKETVSFNAVVINGDQSATYTLTAPTVSAHTAGCWADRLPLQGDTLANVKQEVQYDSVAAPSARMKASGNGYSSGTGSYTLQFYLTGNQALTDWVSLGLSDTGVVGAGSLHHHLLLGYTHLQGNDVEVDVTLTLSNA